MIYKVKAVKNMSNFTQRLFLGIKIMTCYIRYAL